MAGNESKENRHFYRSFFLFGGFSFFRILPFVGYFFYFLLFRSFLSFVFLSFACHCSLIFFFLVVQFFLSLHSIFSIFYSSSSVRILTYCPHSLFSWSPFPIFQTLSTLHPNFFQFFPSLIHPNFSQAFPSLIHPNSLTLLFSFRPPLHPNHRIPNLNRTPMAPQSFLKRPQRLAPNRRPNLGLGESCLSNPLRPGHLTSRCG